MKKTLSILMALVLALSMCAMTMVTAFAASSDAAVTMESSAAKANVGDVITVSVDVKPDSAQGLGACSFDLVYDTSAFEYVAGTFKSTGMFGFTSLNDKNAGRLVYVATQEEAVKVGGTLATVQFKVLKPGSSIKLELTEVALGDYNSTNVTSAVAANSTDAITIGCNHGSVASTVTKEPTCTEAGEKTNTCSVCGEVLGTESIPATGHNFGAWTVVKEATCAEEGVEERTCADCGEKETRAIAKTAHTPGEWRVAVEATCTEDGLEVQDCSVCDAELAQRTIPAKGHTLEDAEITKMPTCTEDGEQKGVCSVCNEEVVEPIPALGHDVTEWTVDKDKDATCTKDGLKHGVCNRCEEEVEEVIPALGHAFGEWEVVKEATETEEGLKERVCAVCGEKETEVIPKLTAEGEGVTGDTDAPSIPKTSGVVIGSVASLAMLSMAAGVAVVTAKKKRKEDK